MSARRKALSTVLLGALLLTGCSGGSSSSDEASTASSEAGDSGGVAAPGMDPARPDSDQSGGAMERCVC